ncbi:unnamed protein product [Fusarium graminearum]|nr:unnamed protein product [Fusarium graminearum]CAG1994533.1 unnamed protein product [Fusarium graminearum]
MGSWGRSSLLPRTHSLDNLWLPGHGPSVQYKDPFSFWLRTMLDKIRNPYSESLLWLHGHQVTSPATKRNVMDKVDI